MTVPDNTSPIYIQEKKNTRNGEKKMAENRILEYITGLIIGTNERKQDE